MGSEVSRNCKREAAAAQRRLSHGFLSNMAVPIAHRRGHSADFSRPVGPDHTPSPVPVPVPVPRPRALLPPEDGTETPAAQTPPLVSVFLPEFPLRRSPGADHFQILGVIAKGSYGPILKVKDAFKDKTLAVKVLPKSELLKYGVVEQSKEEVIIQRQLKHPFIHTLQDCWQTQRHLFIMCDYCSVGDLFTCWLLIGRFGQDDVRIFAAELGSALGFLHDLGIIHRDVKLENILLSDQGHLRLSDFGLSRRLTRGGQAFTICGTIQYMAPEVLGGGPYSHAADWWSLGIMLFSLVTGEYPVPAEPDHNTMLNKVRDFPYVLPRALGSALTFLLAQLLCKNPAERLRNLDCFKMQSLFCGFSFDPHILQKTPVDTILRLRAHPDWAAKARRGLSLEHFDSFDCDQILNSPSEPAPPEADVDLSPGSEQTCEA